MDNTKIGIYVILEWLEKTSMIRGIKTICSSPIIISMRGKEYKNFILNIEIMIS
jgi:hypothetical protein